MNLRMMKNKMKLVLVGWFLVYGFLDVYAQTLEEILVQIDTQNLRLRSIDLAYQSALHKGDQYNQRPDATVNLAAFPLPIETRLGPQYLKLGATQMLPWKSQLQARKYIEDVKAHLISNNRDLQKKKLIYQVMMAYADLYEIEEKHKILDHYIKNFEGIEKFALAQNDSGHRSLADVLLVQMKIKALKNEQLRLENQKKIPTVFINKILNRPLDEQIENIQGILKKALPVIPTEQHPALTRFDIQKEIALSAKHLNNEKKKPVIGVGLDYILVGKRTDASPSGNGRDILIPRASITIPLNKDKYKAKAQEEEIKIQEYALEKEDKILDFQAQITQVNIQLEDIALSISLVGEQKALLKSTLKILESEYSATGTRFDEVIKLQNEEINYDLQLIKLDAQKSKLFAKLNFLK